MITVHTIQTMRQFIQECDKHVQTGKDLYAIYEEETSDEVRAQLMKLSHPDSVEPFRDVMELIGYSV